MADRTIGTTMEAMARHPEALLRMTPVLVLVVPVCA